MNIGIFGGTFDPIHVGHLIMAETALDRMALDEVWFMPTHTPPHKRAPYATCEQRLTMVEKAIANHPRFAVSRIELEGEGPSYTVDTMAYLTQHYSQHRFFLIMGADMIRSLPTWKQAPELLAAVKIIGLVREGYSLAEDDLEDPLLSDVTLLKDGASLHLSSTYIRQCLAQGHSVRYLVPDAVRLYMEENQLYGAK